MASRVSSPIFVGRERELESVVAALAESRDAQSRFVLLEGEAGVGKSRFARELERRAQGMGVRVLEGACLPLGGEGLPFGAVIEALRSLTLTVDHGELVALAGHGRAELGRMIPELDPAADAPLGPTDHAGQSRLFEHLLRFLAQLADREPVVIVLEDLHWADRSTLELLGFLARNLRSSRVLVVATIRTDEPHRSQPLRSLIAELDRAGFVERVELRRFDKRELAQQLEGIRGAPPDPGVLSRIAARTDGNAFYAEELLAAGAIDGELPSSLRELLLARLAGLSEEGQELLRVASAAGQRVSSGRLAAVTGWSHGRLEELLREAMVGHVLVLDEGPPGGGLSFRHALIREAAYSDLLPGERARLHAAYAEVIAAESAGQGSAAGELAYHWEAANDLPRAFSAWIEAALGAEAIHASAEARQGFERALELWDVVPDAASQSPLDRVELLTRAAFHAARPEPSRSVGYIRTAIELVDPETDPTRAGLLYDLLGEYSRPALDGAQALAAYTEAVRLVPVEPPSAARAWVLSGLGQFLAITDRPAQAVTVCQEALAVARAAGARHIEPRALVPLGLAQVMLGDVEAGLAGLRRGRELAAEGEDLQAVAWASTCLAGALADAGRYAESAAVSIEAEGYAVNHGLGARWAPTALLSAAGALFQLGRWDEAVDALTRAQRYELHENHEFQVEAQLLLIEVGRGRFEAANRGAHRVRALAERFGTGWTAALAELARWQGDPQGARAAIEPSIAHPDTSERALGWAFGAGIAAEADLAVLARSRSSAAELAEARARGAVLVARMRTVVTDVAARLPYAVPLVTAQLASCEAEFSRLDATPEPDRWALAAAAWGALEIPYERAYALMREGEAAVQRRDRARAERALREADAIAVRLGAWPLRWAIERLATPAGMVLAPAGPSDSAPPPPRTPVLAMDLPAPAFAVRYRLTRRESEVLGLLAAGRSNSEIGELLFISRKTVAVHLANVKAKLGASSRVQMAILARDAGLVAERAHADLKRGAGQAPASPT